MTCLLALCHPLSFAFVGVAAVVVGIDSSSGWLMLLGLIYVEMVFDLIRFPFQALLRRRSVRKITSTIYVPVLMVRVPQLSRSPSLDHGALPLRDRHPRSRLGQTRRCPERALSKCSGPSMSQPHSSAPPVLKLGSGAHPVCSGASYLETWLEQTHGGVAERPNAAALKARAPPGRFLARLVTSPCKSLSFRAPSRAIDAHPRDIKRRFRAPSNVVRMIRRMISDARKLSGWHRTWDPAAGFNGSSDQALASLDRLDRYRRDRPRPRAQAPCLLNAASIPLRGCLSRAASNSEKGLDVGGDVNVRAAVGVAGFLAQLGREFEV